MSHDQNQAVKTSEFEKELQQFAKDVEILCALEFGGKVSPADAYSQIKGRWKKLKAVKKELMPKKSKASKTLN